MENKNKFELISEMMDDRPLAEAEAKMLANLLLEDEESQQRFREYQAIGEALRALAPKQESALILSEKNLKGGWLPRTRAAVATTLSVVAVCMMLAVHHMQGRFSPDMNALSFGISSISFEMQGLSDYESVDSSETPSVAHSKLSSDSEEHDKKSNQQDGDVSISTDSDRTSSMASMPPVA